MTLQEKYEGATSVLELLFGADALTENIWRRLNEIHDATEELWREQLNHVPDDGVKYLLIAEAPPWSEKGDIQYFYNPESKSRTFLKAVIKAFGLKDVDATDSSGRIELLRTIGKSGFLLCDSLPFAMNYSGKNRRKRANYMNLVSMTAHPFLQHKINDSGIKWHKELRIAFGVTLNARPLIKHLNGKLFVGNCEYPISEEMIAVNEAHYPSANRLRTLFGLKVSSDEA